MKFWNWGPLTIWHTAECPFFFFKNRSTLICSGIQQISEKLDPAFVLNILGYILCTSAMTWLLLSIMSLAGIWFQNLSLKIWRICRLILCISRFFL